MKMFFRDSMQLHISIICVLLAMFSNAISNAQTHKSVLQKYLTDDVVAFAKVDLTKIDPTAFLQQLKDLGYASPPELIRMQTSADMAQMNLRNLNAAGISEIYILLRLSDIAAGAPSIIVPVSQGSDMTAALKQWKQTTQFLPPLTTETGQHVIYSAAKDSQFQRLKDAAASPADQFKELAAAISTMDDAAIALVVCGDADSRKVARSLLPTLPPPFESITGKLLADDLQWGAVNISLPPTTRLNIQLQATTDEAAKRVAQAISPALRKLKQIPDVQAVLPDGPREQIFKALEPDQVGSVVSLSLDDVTGDMEKLAHALVGPVIKLRKSARLAQEKNNLRQLALALHNYYATHEKFPRADGKTEQHSAGLSWRVHLLPFLGESELYQQFNLDEPWDSQTNKQLIQKMPAFYSSPLPEYLAVNQEGRTSYQVPVGPEAIFHADADSETFATIIDGSSNTLFVVTTIPESTVIWTQPSDWNYDMENVLKGLQSEERDSFVVARADGYVEMISMSVDLAVLKAMVTSAGRDAPTISK